MLIAYEACYQNTCAVSAKLILDKVGVDIAGMPKDAVTCPIPAGPETTREIRIETSPTAQDHLIWVITNTPGSTVGPSRQLFGLAWLSSLSENKSTRKGRKRCKLDMLNVKLISSLICQTLSAASTGKIHLPCFRLPPSQLELFIQFQKVRRELFQCSL